MKGSNKEFKTVVPGNDKKEVEFGDQKSTEYNPSDPASKVGDAGASTKTVKENDGKQEESNPKADDQQHDQNSGQNDLQNNEKSENPKKEKPENQAQGNAPSNNMRLLLYVAAIFTIAVLSAFFPVIALPGMLAMGIIGGIALTDTLKNQSSQPSMNDKSGNNLQDKIAKEVQQQLEYMNQGQQSARNQGESQQTNSPQQAQKADTQEQEDPIQKTLENLRARVEELEKQKIDQEAEIEKLKGALASKEEVVKSGEKAGNTAGVDDQDRKEGEEVQESREASDLEGSALMGVAKELGESVSSASKPDQDNKSGGSGVSANVEGQGPAKNDGQEVGGGR